MHKTFSKVLASALASLLVSFVATPAVEAGSDVVFFNPMQSNLPEEYYWYHPVYNIQFNDSIVEMQDGSQWKVAEDDRAQMMSWRIYDNVIITVNGRHDNYAYYLTNQSNGTYVRVNLIRGPAVNGAYTLLIKGMNANNYYSRSLTLTNDTSWGICSDDFYQIDSWELKDPIIVGRNDAWFTSYPTLLINVPCNTSMRVKKL